MKYTFTLLTALLLLTGQVNTAQAQRQDNPTMTNKYFKLDFSGGINGNVAPVKRENSALLGSRPDVVPAFAFRASHLFSKQIGWYAGLRVDLYEEKRTGSYKTGIFGQFIEDFFSELFEPIPSVYPSIEGGLLYRIETGRWSIQPSIGLGYAYYVGERNSSRTTKDDQGRKITLSYRQEADFIKADFGLTTEFYVTPKSYLVFRGSYQQPLQSSTAELRTTSDGVILSESTYHTSTVGRNVYIGLGYGFILGKKNKYIAHN